MDLEEQKALVQRCVALWYDDAGSDELRSLLAPEYVHHSANGDLNAEELIEQLGFLRAAFTDPEYEIVHLLAEGDVVTVLVTVQMTHSGNFLGIEATGRRVSTSGATYFRIRDGAIVEDWDVWGLLSIMRQLEAPGP